MLRPSPRRPRRLAATAAALRTLAPPAGRVARQLLVDLVQAPGPAFMVALLPACIGITWHGGPSRLLWVLWALVAVVAVTAGWWDQPAVTGRGIALSTLTGTGIAVWASGPDVGGLVLGVLVAVVLVAVSHITRARRSVMRAVRPAIGRAIAPSDPDSWSQLRISRTWTGRDIAPVVLRVRMPRTWARANPAARTSVEAAVSDVLGAWGDYRLDPLKLADVAVLRRVIPPVLPDVLPWRQTWPDPGPVPGALTLGVGPAGTRPGREVGRLKVGTHDHPLIGWHLDAIPRLMVTGMTGGGKSSALAAILRQLLPHAERAWLCDGKHEGAFLPWEQLPNVEVPTGDQAQRDAIRAAWKMLKARQAEKEAAKRQRRTVRHRLAVLVIDECQRVISPVDDRATAREMAGMIEDLQRTGRTAGMLVVLATQQPGRDDVGGTAARGQTVSLVAGTIDAQGAAMVAPKRPDVAEWLTTREHRPGRLALVESHRAIELTGWYVPDPYEVPAAWTLYPPSRTLVGEVLDEVDEDQDLLEVDEDQDLDDLDEDQDLDEVDEDQDLDEVDEDQDLDEVDEDQDLDEVETITTIRVRGIPRSGQRRRQVAPGVVAASQDTEEWTTAVKVAAARAWKGPLIDGPILIDVEMVFPRPLRHHRKQDPTLAVLPQHLDKPVSGRWPDTDNALKPTLDAIQGIVIKNDRQIAIRRCQRRYTDGIHDPAGAIIRIKRKR